VSNYLLAKHNQSNLSVVYCICADFG